MSSSLVEQQQATGHQVVCQLSMLATASGTACRLLQLYEQGFISDVIAALLTPASDTGRSQERILQQTASACDHNHRVIVGNIVSMERGKAKFVAFYT